MSLQRVPIKDYRGGLNTRDSPFELQQNESPDLSNVTVSSLVGQLETRKGKTRFDVSGLPETEKIDYAKQVTVGTGTPVLMLSINGSIWVCNKEGKLTKLFKGTAGTIWTFELFSDLAFKDWVYCGNGVDTMQKWDGAAAATVEWTVEKGALPKGSILKVWENRLFISGVAATPQRVFFSEFGDPQAGVAEYGFVDVRGPEEDLDAVQDLAVLGARLFVMKRRSVFFISSAVTMLNRRIGGPGVWGRFQTVELEDKLYFFNAQGIWSTGGVEITMESGQINNYFPKKVNKAALSTVRMVATKDTYPRLFCAVPTGASTSPDTLIELVPHINFRRIGGRRYLLLPAFFLHTLPCSALATYNPTEQEELLIGAGLGASTAGKTTFPIIPISDSFTRANEVPLGPGANWIIFGGGGGGGMPNTVAFNLEENAARDPEPLFESTGRWKAGGEIKDPTVEVEVEKLNGPNDHHVIELFACLKNEEFNNGYRVSFSKEKAAGAQRLLIERRVASIVTELLNINLPTKPLPNENFRVGMTVFEGKIKVWLNVAGKGWELLAEVADATFNKGYSGVGLFGDGVVGKTYAPGALKNFRTASVPAVSNKLSSMFVGTTDEGAEISAYWHSAWLPIQTEEPKERVRRLNVELQGDAVVDVFTDFSELPLFSSTVPKSGGEGSEYRFARVRPETRGRFHSVKVRTLVGGQPFLINAMEAVVRGGKEH